MAEAAFEHPHSLKDELEAKMSANNNKRKRSSIEAQQARPAPGFDKDMDFPGNPEEGMNLTEADFSALAQHNNPDHTGQSNGSNAVRDASDTAAAALTAYNGLTVPQPTEMSFQPQATATNHTGSFNIGEQSPFTLDSLKNTPGQGGSSTSPTQSTPSQKPAVGSDEWHRVRRDNHKEGMF